MPDVEAPQSLGDALYAALRLSRPRLRFMATFTGVVMLITVGLAFVADRQTEGTAVVDISAFTESGTPAFEVQSLTDQFIAALSSPAAIEATAEEVGESSGALRAGITHSGGDDSTRVTVSYLDADGERAQEIATAAARNALRDLGDLRVAAASRDVAAATERLDNATTAVAAFEAEVGLRNVVAESERLGNLVEQLSQDLPTSAAPLATQAALAQASAARDAMLAVLPRAQTLEAERGGAQEQLLAANQQLSRARSQLAAAEADDVVRPGFSTTQRRLPKLVTAAGTGLVIGVVVSYIITAFTMDRRKPAPVT